jgi:hypothetical protein
MVMIRRPESAPTESGAGTPESQEFTGLTGSI